MQALRLYKIEARYDDPRRAGTARSAILFVNADSFGCSCSPRSANSKRSQCRGMGCVKAIALLEPGPSFCWGPALEGPTSPSSTRSSMPGKVDEIDTPGAPLVRPPPLQAPQPPRSPHAPIPPPCTTHASLARLTTASPPLCDRVRRSSTLPFYLDQSRGWRVNATR